MDKITTALNATEDNAAAIRALSNKLREQSEKNETAIDELRGQTESQAAAMTKLSNLLEKRTTNTVITGKSVSGGVSLGTITSDGTVCVLLTFEDIGKHYIYFCKKAIAAAYPPAFLVLPIGRGELVVATASRASALVFGGVGVAQTT